MGFILKKHLAVVWRDVHAKRKHQEDKFKRILDLKPGEQRKQLGFL